MNDPAEAVRRARAAQVPWSALSVLQRLAPVRRLRQVIAARAEELVSLLAEEPGKPANEVLGGELLPACDALAWLEKRAAALLAPRRVRDTPLWLSGQSDTVHRAARGVVGIIGTWNYPLFLNGVQVAQALAAGNAVVWKPSEVVPRFAAWFAERMAAAGFPDGVFHALPATREMGPALAEADVDHVVFTGSAAVGRRLAARLGERLVSS
ncbi:MAG: aldehyde dehydrogenase family protein, partial [Gemmataceae bacterium]|nr:aldehyde dehydrogenase family protein [Gemmataceae bacterium]